MKTYTGSHRIDGIKICVDGQPLDERNGIQRFTNTGFEWPCEDAAPHQLALALLTNHLSDDGKALELSERFMKAKITELGNNWSLSGDKIDVTLADLATG